jgi:hypothetical protein
MYESKKCNLKDLQVENPLEPKDLEV